MIMPSEAWRLIASETEVLGTRRLPLAESLDYILAEDVCADRDNPACNRSAMDGYALLFSDTESLPVRLSVVDEVPAGSAKEPQIQPGECVRIFTGASVPKDADTVIMQEHVETLSKSEIMISEAVKQGQHILRRGENAVKGEILVPAGTKLNAAHISICASVGCDYPVVYEKPKVSILTTGAELKDAGEEAADHEIRDSNGPMLAAILEKNRFRHSAATVLDELDKVAGAISLALETSDVLLVTGGVSVGKYDLVEEAAIRAGGRTVYHGVKIKPGKPQLFAVFDNGKYLFGLPGNPLSSLVGMHEFALPALWLLAGLPEKACRPLSRLRSISELHSKGKRIKMLLARYVSQDDELCVEVVPCSGSADLVAAGKADGVIIMPEGARQLTSGQMVEFRPWGGLA
ncbi:hypothetical protein BVX97_05825 [bacterium E08(2017)]|nr:hypothetical protein BVX97_05825 [bacterium E08(2017)]